MNCIFCAIANNTLPADKVYEDQHVVAFRDINPLAKDHILIIPKQCRLFFHDLEDDTIAYLFKAIQYIVKQYNFDKQGYRLINNNGQHGAQTVSHAHIHLLAGQQLGHNLTGL